MKKIFFGFLLLVLLGVAILLFRLKVFSPVNVSLHEAGPFTMVYSDHIGPYHKIVPVIESVEGWVRGHGDTCERAFGEYLDDPQSVAQDRLRSRGGCFLKSDKDFSQLVKTEGKLRLYYEVRPPRLYLVLSSQAAPSISPYFIYPKAFKELERRQLKIVGAPIEEYIVTDTKNGVTNYYFPVDIRK